MVERLAMTDGGHMIPWSNGDYVRYSDYAALEAQLAELEAENARLMKDAESYRDIAARKSNQVADMIRAEAAKVGRDRLRGALRPFAEAQDVAVHHEDLVRHLALGQPSRPPEKSQED